MKLIEGIKQLGAPYEIPDCSRDDLPGFFKEMGYKVGAEIGVAQGKFTELFCKEGLKMFGIDPWQAYGGVKEIQSLQASLDSHYLSAQNRLRQYPDCTLIKKTSMEAVSDFTDDSLDFVYIDGDHTFKYVAEDIDEWAKKVKKGGVVAGHDYVYFKARSPLGICHVIPVLNAYTQAYKIDNWYVLGQKPTPPGDKRDKWRSWMFIKP